MSRSLLLALALIVTVSMSGCMGVRHFGTGCQDNCNQCDGYSPRPIPCGPLEGLRNARRSLTCSGGCGEVYYGEWTSTPPDCDDPCDDCQGFTGGCREKCLPCGRLRGLFSGFLGQRYRCATSRGLFNICDMCDSAYSDPGCGNSDCGSCSSCGGGEVYADGDSVVLGESEWTGDRIGSSVPPAELGQFKPMPRARLASSVRSLSRSTPHKPDCNCGKH